MQLFAFVTWHRWHKRYVHLMLWEPLPPRARGPVDKQACCFGLCFNERYWKLSVKRGKPCSLYDGLLGYFGLLHSWSFMYNTRTHQIWLCLCAETCTLIQSVFDISPSCSRVNGMHIKPRCQTAVIPATSTWLVTTTPNCKKKTFRWPFPMILYFHTTHQLSPQPRGRGGALSKEQANHRPQKEILYSISACLIVKGERNSCTPALNIICLF